MLTHKRNNIHAKMKSRSIGWLFLAMLWLALGYPTGLALSPEIQWHVYTDGISRAKFEKKKIFIHFFADWCAACNAMEGSTFRDPVVIAALNENFISIRVDADREMETATLFRVQGLPDNWFIAEDGEIIGHRPGYIPPDQLKNILTLILNQRSSNQ